MRPRSLSVNLIVLCLIGNSVLCVGLSFMLHRIVNEWVVEDLQGIIDRQVAIVEAALEPAISENNGVLTQKAVENVIEQESLDDINFSLWQESRLVFTTEPDANDKALLDPDYTDNKGLHNDNEKIAQLDTDSVIQVEEYPEFGVVLKVFDSVSENHELFDVARIFQIMLIVFALAATAVTAIAGYSVLNRIRHIGLQLRKEADGGELSPIQLGGKPAELVPILGEINVLFMQLKHALSAEEHAREKESLFSVNAAHELLTPLAAIKSEVQLAKKIFDDAAFMENLEGIDIRVNRATHVVEQLVNLAKLNATDMKATAGEEVDFNWILQDTLAQHGAMMESKSLLCECKSDPAFDQSGNTVLGNAEQLRILCRNLIDNAIKYSPHGGLVVCQLTIRDSHLLLVIENEATPIPDYLKPQLYDAFLRRPGESSTGSGLGLAIVREISNLHGAQIDILDANSITGVRVEFSMPLANVSTPGQFDRISSV